MDLIHEIFLGTSSSQLYEQFHLFLNIDEINLLRIDNSINISVNDDILSINFQLFELNLFQSFEFEKLIGVWEIY